LLDFDSFVQIAMVGIFTGFGSAIGNYLALFVVNKYNIYVVYIIYIMKQFCLMLDEKTSEKLQNFCNSHGVNRTSIIRLAVNQWIMQQESKL
jgi:hypothetical protein